MALLKPNIEKLKARGNVKGLEKALARSEWAIRDEATEALAELGQPGAEALVAALRDERWAVATTLGRLGGPPHIDALLTALRDESMNAQSAGYVALKRLGIEGQLSEEDRARLEALYHSMWRELMHAVSPSVFPGASKRDVARSAVGAPQYLHRLLEELPNRSFDDIVEVWNAIIESRTAT